MPHDRIKMQIHLRLQAKMVGVLEMEVAVEALVLAVVVAVAVSEAVAARHNVRVASNRPHCVRVASILCPCGVNFAGGPRREGKMSVWRQLRWHVSV